MSGKKAIINFSISLNLRCHFASIASFCSAPNRNGRNKIVRIGLCSFQEFSIMQQVMHVELTNLNRANC